ncbi:hypothetical protein GF324_11200, partial [bacterium]|nr:hypothetical protein [bacterium]
MKSVRLLLYLISLIAMVSTAIPAFSQSAHELVKEGNQKLDKGELNEALTRYIEAKSTRDSLRAEIPYNIAGVYARRGQQGDALLADSLLKNLGEEAREELRAKAAYNRGTALADAGMYDKAIPA